MSGESIKMMKQYKPSADAFSVFDRAIVLTTYDTRDVPYSQKLADALEFLRQRELGVGTSHG